MKWYNVNCIEELQGMGNFRDISKEVKEEIGEIAKVNYKSWETLYESIVEFRSTISRFFINDTIYFASKTSQYIFYLVELEGEIRMKKLGVTKEHFTNRKKANEWLRKISKEISTENSMHPYAEEATKVLHSIYKDMIEYKN